MLTKIVVIFLLAVLIARQTHLVVEELHDELGKYDLVTDGDCPGVEDKHTLRYPHDLNPEGLPHHFGVGNYFESHHELRHEVHSVVAQQGRQKNDQDEGHQSQMVYPQRKV